MIKEKFLKMLIKGPLQFYGYLKKDILLLVGRKKYLYLSLLLPLIIAGLFLFMLNPSDSVIEIVVCDMEQNDYSNSAISGLDSFKATVLPGLNCESEVITGIKSGKYSLGMVIHKGLAENVENLRRSRITIYYDNTDPAFSSLVAWKIDSAMYPYQRGIVDNMNTEMKSKLSSLRTSVDVAMAVSQKYSQFNTELGNIDKNLRNLEALDTDYMIAPLWLEKSPVYDGGFSKKSGIAFVFPIISLFIILMLSSTSLIYDRNKHFLVRVKSSNSPLIYLIAKLVFFLLLTIVQFIIILLLFMLFGSSYNFAFMYVVEMVLFVSLINTLIGLMIGTVSDNEGIALLFSLVISFPLMLLSGVFFPVQTLPRFFQYAAGALPLSHEISAVKSVMIFSQPLTNEWMLWSLILVVIVYYMIKRSD